MTPPMRKKIIALLFVVLGSVSAISACGGPGDECSKDSDCCGGDGVCVPNEGGQGKHCYCLPEEE